MKRLIHPFLVIWCSLVSLSLPSFGNEEEKGESAEQDSWSGRPVVLKLENQDVTSGRRIRDFVRLVKQVEEEEAAVLVLQMNISAPIEVEAHRKWLDALSGLEVPTATWVNANATGVGALLALATDAIYFDAGGIMGAAGVEAFEEGDEKEGESKKASSPQRSAIKARARSLARVNGYRVDVVEAMIDEGRELKIGEKALSTKGELLTVTADEAVMEDGGQPLLAAGVVDDQASLLEALKVDLDAVEITLNQFGADFDKGRISKAREKGSQSADNKGDKNKQSGRLYGKRDGGSYQGKVVVVKVGAETLATGKASFEFMERTIKKAELDGAAGLVFDMDTPGGYAWYTEGLVLNSLQNTSYPTFTFVNARAESAGAIIAVGTDHIYMRPAATIGSALVVGGGGGDLPEALEDKITQMIIGTVRNVAALKGHNPDVAEAFVTRDKEVKIDGVVIHEEGHVLNLNTIRATEVIGGKPVLAKGIASSIEEILEAEGIEAEIVKAEALGMEAFAHWVQKFSALLIMIGIAGAYIEVKSPGFGIPGLICVLAFTLFFFGNHVAGNLAGYELAVLLVLGIVLIVIEIFVFPGAMIPGVVGGILVLASLGMAMVDQVDLEWTRKGLPGALSWGNLVSDAFTALSIGLVGSLGIVLLGMRFLPETRMGRRLILEEAVSSGAALSTQDEEGNEKESLVGVSGQTTTDLVPSGKARIDDRLIDVVSDGEFIAKGTEVKVTHHEGSRVVVGKVGS